MKLLYFTNQYVDTARMSISTEIEMSKALRQRGVEVYEVYYYENTPALLAHNPGHIFFMKSVGERADMLLLTYQRLLLALKLRPDFVLSTNGTVFSLIPLAIANRLLNVGPKVVLDIRSVPVGMELRKKGPRYGWRYHITTWLAARLFSGVTAISKLLSSMLVDEYKIAPQKADYWASGADIAVFRPGCESNVRSMLGLDGRFVILYHGSISPRRNVEHVIDAIRILKDEIPDVFFMILGAEVKQRKVQAMISENGLEKHVCLLPPVPHDEVPKYIAASDIGIIPLPSIEYWNISNPIKLLEYLAMGKVVLATDIPAHRDVMGDSPCAIYMSDSQPSTIARAIRQAYELREELPARGRHGREIIVSQYQWVHQADRLIAFLSGLDGKKQ
ncbi:MAG: glycosyltransferase [Pseudomonadota bacterium]